MLWILLTIVTGIAAQIAMIAGTAYVTQKFTPEQWQRRTTFIGCLLATIVIIQVPWAVAVAYGSLPISDAAWIGLAGGVILLLGLLANSGNLLESSVPPVLIVWFAIFLVPGIRLARERVIREQEQKRQHGAPHSKTDAANTPPVIDR